MELFGRIRRIRRCGLVGESASLEVGFEASKPHARITVSLAVDQDVALSYCSNNRNVSILLP